MQTNKQTTTPSFNQPPSISQIYHYFKNNLIKNEPDPFKAVFMMLRTKPDYYSYIISRSTVLSTLETTTLAVMMYNPEYTVHPDFLFGRTCMSLTIASEILDDDIFGWEDPIYVTAFFHVDDYPGVPAKDRVEVYAQLQRLRSILTTAEILELHYDISYYPVFRALTDMQGEHRSVNALPPNPQEFIQEAYFKLRPFDRERLLQCGDVESNPGPIHPPEHLRERFIYQLEPPALNPHSIVDNKDTHMGTKFDDLLTSLIQHISRTPAPLTFMKFQHIAIQTLSPIRLKQQKDALPKIVDVTHTNRGPITIRVTPFKQAISLLSDSNGFSGMWSVPIYSHNNKLEPYHKFSHLYRRKDGKIIRINVSMCEYSKKNPTVVYVNVDDLSFVFQDYMSLCITRYFGVVMEKTLLSGERNQIKYLLLTMFLNNALVVSSLESCIENSFEVTLYGPRYSFSMSTVMPPIIGVDTDAYEMILRAPLKTISFEKWILRNKWYYKKRSIDLSVVRFSPYGFGALVSFGTFQHHSENQFYSYMFRHHEFSVLPPTPPIDYSNQYLEKVGHKVVQLLLKQDFNVKTPETHTKYTIDGWTGMEEIYAITQIMKQCFSLGVNKNNYIFFPTKVELCVICYTNLQGSTGSISHCVKENPIVRKAYKQFNKELVIFEGVFNYWFQKTLGISVPTWNSFLYHCYLNGGFYIKNRIFFQKPDTPTMFKSYAIDVGKQIAAPITSTVGHQLEQTQNLIDDFAARKLIPRIDSVVERLEKALPFGEESDCGISNFITVIDQYVSARIFEAIKMIFPLFDESMMPKMSMSKIIRDYILMKHVDNAVIKSFIFVDMLSNAGLLDSIKKFFSGFELISKVDHPTSMWSDFSDWISFLIAKPTEWMNHIGGFISGMVSTMLGPLDKINPKHLLSYIADVAPSFRNIAGIGSGLNALGSIYTFICKTYYLAKEYVYKVFGKTCNVPMYVHMKEHLANWSSAVSTLILPQYRNSILNTSDAWSLIDNVHDIGLKLMLEAKSPAINSTMASLLKELMKLRIQISTKRGIRQSTFVPFVIHLNGPVNIGKSTLWAQVVEVLSETLGIRPETYMYNEQLKYMDGYSGQEFLVCDDANLSKDPDACAWLIKMVAPNLCFLPTAVNEERPMISNVKVVILTSNTLYSPAVGLATTHGIDRRSRYKFEVSAKHYDKVQHKIPEEAKQLPDFDWQTEHNFVRMPSVEGDTLSKQDQFKGTTKEWLKYIIQKAHKHKTAEAERIAKSPVGTFEAPKTDHIRNLLMDGMSPGTDPIDLQVIRDKISTIKFITPESFLQQPTMQPDPNHITTVIDRIMSKSPTQLTVASAPPIFERASNAYPRFTPEAIVFDAPFIDPEAHNLVATEHLHNRPFSYLSESYDFYFLHHLKLRANEFYIDTIYKREEFRSHNVAFLPIPTRFDYVSYTTLLADTSFMLSWKQFFSHNQATRVAIFQAYKNRINTTRELIAQARSWKTKLSRFFSNLFERENLEKMVVCALLGMTSIASVAMVYEMLASMMNYDLTKKYTEAALKQLETSQPGKSKQVANTAVKHVLTSLHMDQCYEDVRNKVKSNLYLAKMYDYEGKIHGACNILFISERFALINHHMLRGLQPETHIANPDLIAIFIYIPRKGVYEKYYFSRTYYRFPGKDAVLIQLSTFQAQSNIMKLWMKEDISSECFGSPTEILFYRINGDQCCYESQHGKYIQQTKSLLLGTSKNPFSYKDLYLVDCLAPLGSSGGFVLLNNTMYQTKIMGIQVSSGEAGSHVQKLLYHELVEAIQFYHDRSNIKYETSGQIVTCDVTVHDGYDPEVPSLIGVVDKQNAVTISPKTQLKKTPYYGVFIDPPNKTPVLSRVSKEDRYLYTNKTEKTSPKPFDEYELDTAVVEYSEHLKSVLRKKNGRFRPLGALSISQVLNGTYTGGKTIDLTTSPGIGIGNWIHNRQLKGQHDFVERIGEEYKPKPILTKAVHTELSTCMSGIPSSSTYASFPKDELRNKDARGIDGAPIEQKIVYKMLFGALDGMLSNANEGDLRYGLGIDLFSNSGVNLLSRITPLIMMWDFSNYDGSITYQMYNAVTNIYNHLSDNDEFSVARHTLSYKTCFSTIIADDKVYQPLKGMRSGFGGTSSFNTHIHNLFLIIAIKQLIRENSILYPTIHDVFELVDWITYGDDGLAWLLKPECSDYINGETISQKFIDFGLIVADPRGKSTLPPRFVTIEEATFLKQSPYYDDTLGLPMWRVNEECLSSVFSYYSGDDPFEALDCAFRMLWPYGRERYELYRKHLNKVLENHGRVYSRDWITYQKIFLESLQGTSYTGSVFNQGLVNCFASLD
nr:MAG: nonstructural protein [Riboviria sp.]